MAQTAGNNAWPDEIGIAYFADTIGLSERRVYDLAKAGIVVRGSKPGRLMALPSMHGYLDYIRRRAADIPSAGPLRMERLKSEIVGRQIQEVRLAEIREKILTIAEITESWADFAGRIKKAVLSIPQAALDQIPSLTPHDEMTIRTMVFDILDGLVDEAEASVIGSDPELLKPTAAERAGIPRRRNSR